MRKLKYARENLLTISRQEKSIAGCLRKLGVRPTGGSYKFLKTYFKKYEIDISHFTGKRSLTGIRIGPRKALNDFLTKDSYVSSNFLRKRLISDGVKSKECEKCKNHSWNGLPIPLELHHVNGDNADNRLENLQILCPNCHSQIPTRLGKASMVKKREELISQSANNSALTDNLTKLCSCGSAKGRKSKRCKKCSLDHRPNKRPTKEDLAKDLKDFRYIVEIGAKYGVSDNAVRKWMRFYNLATHASR
jgi:5-methylcytosine-specific restriction endonuclease McrA